MRAARADHAVFVSGAVGSGRTTFALTLFRQLGFQFYWLTGSRALREVPFAVVSSLCSQIPQTRQAGAEPVAMIAALTSLAASTEIWILLDRAEQVDEHSAAVLAQLATAQNLHLVVASTGVRHLPAALGQLATLHQSHKVQIQPLDLQDADFLASHHVGGPVESITIRRLLHDCGGNPLHLRELLADAQQSSALRRAGEYWTLHPQWEPTGERITDLVNTVLQLQADSLRATVAQLALTGPLPLRTARRILGGAELDATLDAGLVRLTRNPASQARRVVELAPDLPGAAVVASLGQARLRRHLGEVIERARGLGLDRDVRTELSVHCHEVGYEPPFADLDTAVALALEAERHTAVLTLTEQLDGGHGGGEQSGLLAARALAQHASGDSAGALATLEVLLDGGDPTARMAAAQIRLALGEPQTADSLLAPQPQDPPQVAGFRLVVRHAGGVSGELEALQCAAQDAELPADVRMRALAQYCLALGYSGHTSRALDVLESVASMPVWVEASPAARGHLLAAVNPVLMQDGGTRQGLQDKLAPVTFRPSGLYGSQDLLARGSIELDQGHAAAALLSLGQAMSRALVCDPDRQLGIIAALRSHAAALLGDRLQVHENLALSRQHNTLPGKVLRLEAERALLPALAVAEGAHQARARLDALFAEAEARGQAMQCLRLRHDAWRLGLEEDTTTFSELAAGLEGHLAETLAGYGSALRSLDTELDTLIQRHIDHGRLLYAAELANHASELALTRGERARSSQLLGLCAEIARPLASVNSPRLGRARIDPLLLSDREFAACTRAARGESNTTIAAELYLSPRTVEGHLQRSYAKLGIRDRRQLIDDSAGTSSG